MGPTEICNMALARLGAKRINNYDDASNTKVEAIQCRLFYEQTAKALMRSHWWRFAKRQAQLSADTDTPTFQWTYSYELPNDFLRLICFFDDSDYPDGRTHYTYELMGTKLYTDQTAVYLKYVAWVDEEAAWDPLFVEVMVLSLAKKLIVPLSLDLKLKEDINKDLEPLMRQVRALDRQEQEIIGRFSLRTWEDARYQDTA